MNNRVKGNCGKVIYHYTSWDAFVKIFRNKSLRMGDLQSMNDVKESIHFLDIFEHAICAKLKESNFEDKIPEAKNIIRQVRDNVYVNRAYALCFTKLSDDAAQWERYGQMGQGVCIGFNSCELQRQIIKCRLGFSRIQEVYYLDSIDVHEHLDIFYELLTIGKSQQFRNIDDWTSNLHATASAFKHQSFQSEQEVRLVSIPISWDQSRVYEAKQDRIRSYIEIKLPELEECIEDIIIGPRSSQDIDELNHVLTKWEYQNIVDSKSLCFSSCPLR